MSKVIERLIKGYQRFRKGYFEKNQAFFEQLVANGQQPKTLVIACADSRVDPSIILNCQPGDLFVVRNVANLVPPYESDDKHHGTSAALEFAVTILEVQHIIILGHTHCGGIQALLTHAYEATDSNSFITKWMELAEPACQQVLHYHGNETREQQHLLCGQQALLHSLQNLTTFPWIQERLSSGHLALHAWYFDLTTGSIYAYNDTDKGFNELSLNYQKLAKNS